MANKLIFKLKQHTPMIHFLHDQPGATLRATELKPKLDGFLIKHAFGNDFEKYKTFLIGWKQGKQEPDFEGKKAFDYKVKIVTGAVCDNDHGLNKYLYFGDMGSKSPPKKAIFYKDDLRITFFSFDTKLLETIKNSFVSFLSQTNFGTRQNKGFGSFFMADLEKDFIDVLKTIVPSFLYIQYEKSVSITDRFNDIEIIYRLMKSGINFPDHHMVWDDRLRKKRLDHYSYGANRFYFKSFLSQYFLNKKIGNEKRFIKEEFFEKRVRINPDGLEKRYIRSVLGICDGVEFKGKERKGHIKYSSSIDRFKSPVTFKIVDGYTVIIPDPSQIKLVSKTEFKFVHKDYGEKSIFTPEDFDLIDFLKQYGIYFNKLDISKLDQNNSKSAMMIKHAKQNTIMRFDKGDEYD